MAKQLELPGLRHAHNVAAARAVQRLGAAQWWCTACGFEGHHTPTQCSAMRPRCHVDDCELPTCIQAPTGGHLPTCLDHYFARPLPDTP